MIHHTDQEKILITMVDKENICSYCKVKACIHGNMNDAPKFCPTISYAELLEEAKHKLKENENLRTAQNVARTWQNLGKRSRIEMLILFAKFEGFRKLGLAFCASLGEEARFFTNLLLNEGFEVASVCCMCGALSSEDVELPEKDKYLGNLVGSRQPQCNPIGQAMLLNAQKCDLNILLGHCVGDDTLFIKHSHAPVTVLAVKDLALAHNPLKALDTTTEIGKRLNFSKP